MGDVHQRGRLVGTSSARLLEQQPKQRRHCARPPSSPPPASRSALAAGAAGWQRPTVVLPLCRSAPATPSAPSG
eukprot:8575591-Alexandrium_andersonii.AAC.1